MKYITLLIAVLFTTPAFAMGPRKNNCQLDIPCVISMDLGGPKIRTGPIELGPQIQKIRPRKNVRGKIVKAARIWFGPQIHSGASNYTCKAR